MERRQLGRGGPRVSVLGLSASPIGVTLAGDELAAIDRILAGAPRG